MEDRLDLLNERIWEALKEYVYLDRPFEFTLFAMELNNVNGFAFTIAKTAEPKALAKAMRRFADKVENGLTIPPTKGVQ